MTAPGKAIVTIDDAAIKARMRGLLADAWDEGHAFDCARCQLLDDDPEHPNPYRDEAQA
jgi:hypothetical protein